MKQYKYNIKNLDCANCASELERALQKIDKIENVCINFMTQKLIFECREEQKEEIMIEIRNIIKKKEPDVVLEEA